MEDHKNLRQITYRISFINIFLSAITAMIGHIIHGSIFWTIIDFIFPIFAWIKWIIMKEVSMKIIREIFSFFLKLIN